MPFIGCRESAALSALGHSVAAAVSVDRNIPEGFREAASMINRPAATTASWLCPLSRSGAMRWRSSNDR